MNNLAYDKIHLSHDKTVLFGDCRVLVDDSPFTLEKATKVGITATGLTMPWNENKPYCLFKSLPEVLSYLKTIL